MGAWVGSVVGSGVGVGLDVADGAGGGVLEVTDVGVGVDTGFGKGTVAVPAVGAVLRGLAGRTAPGGAFPGSAGWMMMSSAG